MMQVGRFVWFQPDLSTCFNLLFLELETNQMEIEALALCLTNLKGMA